MDILLNSFIFFLRLKSSQNDQPLLLVDQYKAQVMCINFLAEKFSSNPYRKKECEIFVSVNRHFR